MSVTFSSFSNVQLFVMCSTVNGHDIIEKLQKQGKPSAFLPANGPLEVDIP
jgi:hypothetical protein